MTAPTQAQIEAKARELLYKISCIDICCRSIALNSCGCYKELFTALTAAAEAGEQKHEERYWTDMLEAKEAATIERCARVAKGCYTGEEAAIRIRAMKEQP